MNNDNHIDPYDELVHKMQRDAGETPDPVLREKMEKALGGFTPPPGLKS